VELRQYLRTVRSHWLLIVAAVVLCSLAAAFLTRQPMAVYQSTTKLLVLSRSTPNADASESYQGELLAQSRVKTYADLVTAPAVMQAVVSRLRLKDSPDGLRARIGVTLPEGTALIAVTVDAGSAAGAQTTAEAVADEFARYVDGIEQARARSPDLVVVSPVQAATLPGGPKAPHRLLDLIIGALAGLALGIAGAVLRELVDGRVRDETDVARIIQTPVFSTVAPRRRWRTRVRSIRPSDNYLDFGSVLLRLQEDRPGRPVTVLGPTRAAGASDLVANVARALARSPLRVVLITRRQGEALPDDRRGSRPGLYDVLAGRAPARAALQPADGETWLWVLSADVSGSLRPALDPRQVQRLMTDLHELADVVLIDGAPLDESVEGAVLAAYCGGAVLVARPRRTRRKELARAVETLRDLSTAPTSVVLTPKDNYLAHRPAAPAATTPRRHSGAEIA
jgi:succinoglycan biosynthesis transport protein ExoP